MTVKEILYKADLLLDAGLPQEIFVGQSTDQSVADEVSSNQLLQRLVKCVNLVCDEIATDYFPVVQTQTVNVTNGEIDFSLFNNKVQGVVSVKDEGGKNVNFCYSQHGIANLECKQASVRYRVAYQWTDFWGEVNFGSPQVTSRVVAYGVVAQYYLLCGNYDQAKSWSARFYLCLQDCKRGGERVMPQRRWL